jgi:alpha-galactosidase
VAAVTVLPLLTSVVTMNTATASAENNGVGLTPAMGWSSWSFIRHDPAASAIEAQARAMKASGLAAVGCKYINVDDFWYECPGSRGPNVDRYGRWVTDPAAT